MPLLLVGLYQLNSHRRTQNEQAATIVRIETTAAGGTLASWLEAHTDAQSKPIGEEEARSLYAHLAQSVSSDSGAAFTVFDSKGKLIGNPSGSAQSVPVENSQASIESKRWSDGVTRLTGVRRINPSGWSVAVGAPLKQREVSSESILVFAATWSLVLIASIFLGVWAVGRFTKPLLKLAATASHLGEGHLQERAAVETDDEVGDLAQRFNLMAELLEAKFSEVQTQGAFIEEVLDGLPLGVVVLDSKLTVRRANAAFSQFIGREPDTLKDRGLYEAAAGLAILSDVVEDVRRTRRPFVSYGLPLNLVARPQDKEADAQSAWDVIIWPTSERSAGRGDLILILSEVSKRVRAEKLATSAFASERTRAAELESVINQMNEGVIIVNQQGQYRINPAGAQIIGCRADEFRDGAQALIEDMAFRDLDGRELVSAEHPLRRALERREHLSGEQLAIIHADGERRVVAISATPLTDEEGRPAGAVAVFRDITEEVKQHGELVAAYDRLRDHDRLKSAFVSNVTHELRTPLNVIIGLCQLLERDPQLPLAMLQKDAVQRMDRNARALLDMVNELLEYSRLEAGRAALELAFVSVLELAEGTVQEYSAEAQRRGIDLRAEVSPDLDKVVTDRGKLLQVLSSLVGNAVKFTATGSVVISAGLVGEDRWSLEVKDTGIGMPGDALSYIFDEFRQIDDRLARSFGGTGLGLAITRKLVELLE